MATQNETNNETAPARKYLLTQSPPVTGTIASVDAMIDDFAASAADCGPRRGMVMEIAADARTCRKQITSAARMFGRRLDRDAIARATFARKERPDAAWFAQLQSTLRDSVAEKVKDQADAAASELVEDARAFNAAYEGDEATALGPSALRNKGADLRELIRGESAKEGARAAASFAEPFGTWKGLVARNDPDADFYGDAIENIALEISRANPADLAKRLGSQRVTASAITAVRSGDLQKEQAMATQFLAMLRERRAQKVPPHVAACRVAWAKLISIWPQILGMNAWMLAPSQIGTSGPRVAYDFRDELAVDPQWPTRLLPPWPRGIRLPWSPVAEIGAGT